MNRYRGRIAMLKKKTAILSETCAMIFLFLIVLVSIGPFIWVLLSSVKTNREILTFSFRFTNGVNWKNYSNAFRIAPIVRYFRNSIFITGMGILLNLVSMSMAAYVLSRFEFKVKNLVRVLFSMGLLIPGAALLLPIYISIRTVGLYNNAWALILVYTAFGMPTSVLFQA